MIDYSEKFIERARKSILERMNLYVLIQNLEEASLPQEKQPNFEDSEYWYFIHEHGGFKGFKIRKYRGYGVL